MAKQEISPLEQAEQELPQPWYIADRKAELTLRVLLTILTYYPTIQNYDQPPIHLVGAGIYLLSTIADRYSTNKALDAINVAKENGVETDYEEQNSALRGVATAHEFNRNIKMLAKDAVGITVSAIIPPMGTMIGTIKVFASANNFFVAKLHNRATEIAKEKSSRNL
ncbi:MAG: hypothetical protein HY425_01295 [Candidatus Levybacteria bacterium]|nr:hypothetical protein [Candidatus Levybacteria bacterium]